jgi:hypothetical protein
MIHGNASKDNLVQCDISHPQPLYAVSIYADEVDIRPTEARRKPASQRYPNPGIKRPITVFSRKSKLSLMRTIARVRNRERPLWITLTYTDESWRDTPDGQTPARVKNDIDTFTKRLEHLYDGNAGMVWKVEYQIRKSGVLTGEIVPHVHILMVGVLNDLANVRAELRSAWTDVISRNVYGPCRRSRVDVQPLKSWKQVVYYISEYMSKPGSGHLQEDEPGAFSIVNPGRWWAVAGRIDRRPALVIFATLAQVREIRRAARRWLKKRSYRYAKLLARAKDTQGFGVFGLGDMSSPRYGWTVSAQYPAILRLCDFLKVD